MPVSVSLNTRKFGLSAFQLKIIAMVFMTIDHIVWLWGPEIGDPLAVCLRASGRFTFPIMVFLMAEGYHYTRNKWKYLGRLLIFAIISMVPFNMMEGKPWNVLFTLGIGLALLICKDEYVRMFPKVDSKVWLVLFGILSFAISVGLYFCDWGFSGIFAIYIGGQIQNRKVRGVVVPLILYAGYILGNFVAYGGLPPVFVYNGITNWNLIFYSGLFFVIPLLCLYNGEKGYTKDPYTKYMFYVYYPLHIFILATIYYYA